MKYLEWCDYGQGPDYDDMQIAYNAHMDKALSDYLGESHHEYLRRLKVDGANAPVTNHPTNF